MNTYHALALKKDGTTWAWGGNNLGQLGDQTIVSKSSPILVVGAHTFIALSMGGGVGDADSAGLKANGQIWTWGNNSAGQLGDQTITNKSSPVLVVGTHSFVKVAMGEYMCAALKADGTAWTWGYNVGGQLGDWTTASKSSPVLVVGSGMHYFFIQISCGAGGTAGQGHVAALDLAGRAWCWGYNDFGQLGDNTRTNISSPVLVTGAHSFIEIYAGLRFTAGLKIDGTVWCWGDNTNGNLGDQTVTSKSSPVLVVGAHSFIHIYASYAMMIGLKSNGQAWTWGLAASGQLGDNTITNKSSPVLVVGAHNFIKIGQARSAIAGLKANGQIWMWGYNGFGQLGDQTITGKSSPVLVVGAHVFTDLWNQPSYPGIITDATSSSSGGAVTTLTFAHTIGSGQNRMLVVGLNLENSVARTVNSITYNGVFMDYFTYIWTDMSTPSGVLTMIWTMPEANLPAAGTYNIVVTLDAATDRGISAGAISLTNVNQTPTNGYDTASAANVTSLNQTFTTDVHGAVVIDSIGAGNVSTLTPNSGQTSIYSAAGGATMQGAMSIRPVSCVNDIQDGWTLGTTSPCTLSSIVLSPFYTQPPMDWIQKLDHIFSWGSNRGFMEGFDRY